MWDQEPKELENTQEPPSVVEVFDEPKHTVDEPKQTPYESKQNLIPDDSKCSSKQTLDDLHQKSDASKQESDASKQESDASKQESDASKPESDASKQKSADNLADEDEEYENLDAAQAYKLRKNWKKSLTRVFKRGQRSTKSNEGDPNEQTSISQEQKWQSLGKIFRRQSCVVAGAAAIEHQVGENSGGKRISIKQVFSKYLTRKPTHQDGVQSPAAKD